MKIVGTVAWAAAAAASVWVVGDVAKNMGSFSLEYRAVAREPGRSTPRAVVEAAGRVAREEPAKVASDAARAPAYDGSQTRMAAGGTAEPLTSPVTAPPLPDPVNSPISVIAANRALIEDPAIAKLAFDRLGQATSLIDGEAGADRPVFILFDPRCPYCHQAFEALHGKTAIRWVPVSYLADQANGEALAAAILAAPDPFDKMREIFRTRSGGVRVDAETGRRLNENFLTLAGFLADLQRSGMSAPGVPLMFIPLQSGGVEIRSGYARGDDAIILKTLAGGA